MIEIAKIATHRFDELVANANPIHSARTGHWNHERAGTRTQRELTSTPCPPRRRPAVADLPRRAAVGGGGGGRPPVRQPGRPHASGRGCGGTLTDDELDGRARPPPPHRRARGRGPRRGVLRAGAGRRRAGRRDSATARRTTDYERRFGRVFLIRAAGRTAPRSSRSSAQVGQRRGNRASGDGRATARDRRPAVAGGGGQHDDTDDHGQRRARPVIGEPHVTALDWLRDQGLTGAKEGCAEGECGACSVLVARPDGDGAAAAWTALNACLVPAPRAGRPGGRHRRRARHARRPAPRAAGDGRARRLAVRLLHAGLHLQHGGRVLPARPRGLDRRPTARPRRRTSTAPTASTCTRSSGNLCRCTGYRPIRDAAYALGDPPADDALAARPRAPAPAAPTRLGPAAVRPARRPRRRARAAGRATRTRRSIAGCTDWGVEVNIRGAAPRSSVAVDRLPELRTFAGRPTTHRARRRAHALRGRAAASRAGCRCWTQLWPQFASRLIRNGATIGGNLGTGSPIGDTPPALLALRASVVLASGRPASARSPSPSTSPATAAACGDAGELIKAVRVPLPLAPLTAFHKIAKRRFDDISSVAVAFALDVRDGVVTDAAIGLGGVAATPVRATATEAALDRQAWDAEHGADGRGRAARARAPRSTTTGPAPPTGWRCSDSRCSKFYADDEVRAA